MNVKTILAAKRRNLGGDIVSIEPTANLAAAAKLLSAHRIGAVVILGAGGRLAGILSERDIVRALSEHGAAALDLTVGQVMTRNVATCDDDESVASIMERMTAGKFRHMPVIADGQLTGLISIGDVVKHRVEEIESESEAMRDYIRTAWPASTCAEFARLRERGHGLVDRIERFCRGLAAGLYSFGGAMKIEPADIAQTRADEDIGRIACKPRPRDAVLHNVESLHHYGRQSRSAAPAEELPAQRPLAAEHPAKTIGLWRLRRNIVLVRAVICDDRAAAEQV